ncbi:MAG: PTS ascorbate transporter subunit IIC [Erysipelotrichaceae bacterium]
MSNIDEKKQIPLRISSKLYSQIASWAQDDFRSINGQIEYLLTMCVKQRIKNSKYVSEEIYEDFEIDLE